MLWNLPVITCTIATINICSLTSFFVFYLEVDKTKKHLIIFRVGTVTPLHVRLHHGLFSFNRTSRCVLSLNSVHGQYLVSQMFPLTPLSLTYLLKRVMANYFCFFSNYFFFVVFSTFYWKSPCRYSVVKKYSPPSWFLLFQKLKQNLKATWVNTKYCF